MRVWLTVAPPGPPLWPPPGPPNVPATCGPAQGGTRRRDDHRVIGMDDPGHEAEHGDVDCEPGSPQEIAGNAAIRPGGPAMEDHCDGEGEQRGRQEPPNLAAELVVEEAQQA